MILLDIYGWLIGTDFSNKTFMGKHFHLIGHFLKNAQPSENMYEIFFGPLKMPK